MPLEKPFPQNADAERSLLGAILLDNSTLPRITPLINTLDFFHTNHRKIFNRMLKMADAGVAIDFVTLVDALREAGELTSAGTGDVPPGPYVASLADGLPRVSNVEHYAKIVKDASVRRSVIHTCERLQHRALEGEETPAALLASVQQSLAAIAPKTQQIVGGNGKLTYTGREFLAAEFPQPEELIKGVTFKNGSHMILAMPHHLKTWFTLGLTLGATRAGLIMGKLEVPKPVRTMLITVEDYPGDVQSRMNTLLSRDSFKDVDVDAFLVLPRPVGGMDLMDEAWLQRILKAMEEFEPDHVIFDVLRRIFKGDINSPKESASLCEQIDRVRDIAEVAVTVVHHENRKAEDIMRASAGSFNFPGWANVMIRFQRKLSQVINEREVSHVEIEVDHKFAKALDPVRMVLDLASESPVRLEDLEDLDGINELREQLALTWSVADLAEVLGVHKSNAKRRLQKMKSAGVAEKVQEGKRGRQGGLARYQFVGAGE